MSGPTYFNGNVVYWTDGNCYQCGVTSTTNDPTDTTSWVQVPLPAFLVDYIKTAVAADAADDARTEQLFLEQAQTYLDREHIRLEQQGHSYRYTLRRPQQVWLPYGLSNFWWSAVVPWQGSFVTTLTDTLFSSIPASRVAALVDEVNINIVDELGGNILVP